MASSPRYSTAEGLVPVSHRTLLGIFRGELETPLVVRGASRGIELMGGAAFWRGAPQIELERMARGGNPSAQAELARRLSEDPKHGEDALSWALKSAESDCTEGILILATLLQAGIGLEADPQEAARLLQIASDRGALSASVALGKMMYFGTGIGRDYGRAKSLFQGAADAGNVEAIDLLARCHFHGRGTDEDRRLAVRLWKTAADAGWPAANYALGMCLHMAASDELTRTEAMQHLAVAAEQGIDGAMFLLGQCALFGSGVPRNATQAIDWYRRAAAAGNREAEFELGECLAAGVGEGLRNPQGALLHWKAAAERGHARAHIKVGHAYRSGDGVREDRSEAARWYLAAAKLGEAPAWTWLGECLEHGNDGDAVAARKAYECAAKMGDAHGRAELGRCLLHGIGGHPDVARGLAELQRALASGFAPARGELERHWFTRALSLLGSARSAAEPALAEAVMLLQRAAESGHARAAFMLGECLRHGTGVHVDIPRALSWYRRAGGLVESQLAIADLLYFGRSVPADKAEAFAWYQKAAQQHQDGYAMYSCGYCLLHGDGIHRDVVTGLRWLRRAARQGMGEAGHELGMHYLNGTSGRRSVRVAIRWLRVAAELGHAASISLLRQFEPEAA